MGEVQEKVIGKLNELYQNPKSKNFVLHLVRAYLPLDKPKKVFTKPESMKKFKCALTNNRLISVDEIFAIMHSEEYKEGFIEDLKVNAGLMAEGAKADPNYVPLMKKLAKNRIIGYQGTETSTYLCQEGVEGLFQWVCNKLMENDGKINWTIRQMKTDAFLGHFNGSSDPETKKQVSRIKKISRQPKRAKITLGDMDVLQDLKAKMEANEQKGESQSE